jgi:hypothetical protein
MCTREASQIYTIPIGISEIKQKEEGQTLTVQSEPPLTIYPPKVTVDPAPERVLVLSSSRQSFADEAVLLQSSVIIGPE